MWRQKRLNLRNMLYYYVLLGDISNIILKTELFFTFLDDWCRNKRSFD